MRSGRKENTGLTWARKSLSPKRSRRRMSVSEEKYLIGMYRSGISRKTIAERLNRSRHMISRMIKMLIMKGKLDYRNPNMYRTPKTPETRARCIRNMNNPWTREEDRIILDAMKGKRALSAEELKDLEERTGRTTRAIKIRLNILGISIKNVAQWTGVEDDWLRAAYRKGTPVRDICIVLKRSKNSVLQRASRLGLIHPNRHGKQGRHE